MALSRIIAHFAFRNRMAIKKAIFQVAQSVQWLGCVLDGAGFEYCQGQEIFLFSKTSISALRPNCPPIQWVLGFFPWGHTARTCGWLLTSISFEVKNEWSCTSTLPICLHGVGKETSPLPLPSFWYLIAWYLLPDAYLQNFPPYLLSALPVGCSRC